MRQHVHDSEENEAERSFQWFRPASNLIAW